MRHEDRTTTTNAQLIHTEKTKTVQINQRRIMHNESMYDHTSYDHEMISQNTNASVTPLPPGTEAVYRITCMDVLTRGGGQGSQNHCGNVTYRKLVNLNKVRTLHPLFVC